MKETISKIFMKKYWGVENPSFFESALFNFFFASSQWKSVKIYRIARIFWNFDDYTGFQSKKTPALRYATQCTYFLQDTYMQSHFTAIHFIQSVIPVVFNDCFLQKNIRSLSEKYILHYKTFIYLANLVHILKVASYINI